MITIDRLATCNRGDVNDVKRYSKD